MQSRQRERQGVRGVLRGVEEEREPGALFYKNAPPLFSVPSYSMISTASLILYPEL